MSLPATSALLHVKQAGKTWKGGIGGYTHFRLFYRTSKHPFFFWNSLGISHWEKFVKSQRELNLCGLKTIYVSSSSLDIRNMKIKAQRQNNFKFHLLNFKKSIIVTESTHPLIFLHFQLPLHKNQANLCLVDYFFVVKYLNMSILCCYLFPF